MDSLDDLHETGLGLLHDFGVTVRVRGYCCCARISLSGTSTVLGLVRTGLMNDRVLRECSK